VGGFAVLGGLLLSRAAYGRFEPLVTRLFNNLALANTAFANAREFYSYIFWQLLILGWAVGGERVCC
jgi:cell division protein FtsX